MESTNYGDIIDYVLATDVSKELGGVALTTVSEDEIYFMLQTVKDNREKRFLSLMRQSLVAHKSDADTDGTTISDLLERVDKIEFDQHDYESEPDYYHVISFFDVERFVTSIDPRPGTVTSFRNSIFRSSDFDNTSKGYLVSFSKDFIPGLIVKKTDTPANTPQSKRNFIDLRVLEEAYHNHSLHQIMGMGTKKLNIIANLIDRWHELGFRADLIAGSLN